MSHADQRESRNLIRLPQDSWGQCRPLFRDHHRLRPTIDAALEGYFDGYKGFVEVIGDESQDLDIVALRIGTDVLLGGDSSSGHLPEICESLPVAKGLPQWRVDFEGALITPENETWHTVIASATKRELIRQKRSIYSSAELDTDHLEGLKGSLPPGFELMRFDEKMAAERGINVERAALAYVRLRRFFEGGGISF